MAYIGRAQTTKRPLNQDDYDGWKSVRQSKLSVDGSWVTYEISPQDGDGTLVVQAPAGAQKYTIARGYGANFTADGKYLVAKIKPEKETARQAKKAKLKADKMPKDSVVIVTLSDGRMRKYPNALAFALGEDAGNWLALSMKMPEVKKDTTQKAGKGKEKKEPKGDLLVLLNLTGTDSLAFEHVSSYVMADQGTRVLYTQEMLVDTIIRRGVYAFSIPDRKTMPLDTSTKVEEYKNLALDKPGDQAAWMATMDSTKAEIKRFSLHLRDFAKAANVLVADSSAEKLPRYWAPSEYEKPRFSDDGSRLYFGAAAIAEPSQKDTTLLDDELSRVDVWSYTDTKLQPMQDKQRKSTLERNYVVLYEVKSRKLVPLGSEDIAYVDINYKRNLPYFLGKSFEPYQRMSSWELGHSDLYWIDAATGKSSVIARDVLGRSEISPAGKYALWFDERDTLWKVYDHKTKAILDLTKDLKVAFHDEEHDTPDTPNAYGTAGWTNDDKYVLIYDRFDIWRFDPTMKQKPLNLTDQYGRKNKVRLQYLKMTDDEEFVDLAKGNILWGQWQDDKQTGVLRWKVGTDPAPLTKETYAYQERSFQKAKNADKYLFQKGNFNHANELYYTTDWQDARPLTELSTQLDGLSWGSAEQVSWLSSQGTELEGLLFKPEGFDPTKKYPMLVYYYERNSTSLHDFRTPAPSRSTINIPYCVSNGYLVFVPDIVYGGGTPGKNAYDCIVSGVLDLVDRGFVDKENIGIQGQSWGGYQTAYLITQTNLFKAAMAGAIVANMTSAYGGIRWGTGMSRMFQYEKTQSRIGGTLWEKPMYYIENSPLFFADRVRTPLLMMHNDADGSVPWYQGIEFFTALRRLDRPVWMLVYNDEDHNLTKRPNMKDLSIRMYQFFDHYLKAAPMPSWMSEGRTVIEKERWDMKYD